MWDNVESKGIVDRLVSDTSETLAEAQNNLVKEAYYQGHNYLIVVTEMDFTDMSNATMTLKYKGYQTEMEAMLAGTLIKSKFDILDLTIIDELIDKGELSWTKR